MTAGVEIIGDFGTTQIGESAFTMGCVSSGRAGLSPQGNVTAANIGGGSPYTMLAFAGSAPCGYYWYENGTQFHFFSKGAAGVDYIDYWIFDKPVAFENFGMEVFDAGGNRIYHTSNKPLNIIDRVVVANGDTWSGSYGVERVAVIQTKIGMFDNIEDLSGGGGGAGGDGTPGGTGGTSTMNWTESWGFSMVQCNGGSVSISYQLTGSTAGQYPLPQPKPNTDCEYLIVDVSGY